MKNWVLSLLAVAFLFLAIPSQSFAQEQSQTAQALGIQDDDVLSATDFRESVAKSIAKAADESDRLTRFEKRRVQRVMRGGWFQETRKQAVIDHAIKGMMTEELVSVQPDGIQAAADWDAIFGFIERMIPLILQLISLFGG